MFATFPKGRVGPTKFDCRLKSHALIVVDFEMRFSQQQRLLCAVSATLLLAIISNFTYDDFPMMLSLDVDTKHPQQLGQHVPSARPLHSSVYDGTNLKMMKTEWADDQNRRAAEMRARLDEEVPLPLARRSVSSSISSKRVIARNQMLFSRPNVSYANSIKWRHRVETPSKQHVKQGEFRV
jgi:hypothetical protein